MSKNSKIPSNFAKNASKLHKRILDLVTCEDSPYKFYTVRQEYRVSEINPDFKSNREKFDIVILELQLVIECHGKQHYRHVCFGGISEEEAKRIFKKQQQRDEKKKSAAIEAGWAYVVVSYKESAIELDKLIERISEAIQKRKEISEVNITEKPKQKIKSTSNLGNQKNNFPARKNKLKTNNKLKSRPMPKIKRQIWNPKGEK